MTKMTRKSFDRVARRQLGLVTAEQLRRLGWTHHAVLHLCERGLLDTVRRRVYRSAGAPVTAEQAILAAALAAGEDALVSHASAGHLWNLPGISRPETIHLLSDTWSQPRLVGVTGHRTIWLPDHHRGRRGAIPVTSPERTIVDCCGLVAAERLPAVVNDALRRRLATLPRLARTVDEVPRSGRRRVAPIVEVLKTKVPGYDPGDSEPEVDLVDTLAAAGFPRPEQQIRVVHEGKTMYLDAGWSDLRVGYEYDSLEFHVDRFHEDRDRLRRLKRAGWDVWPVTSTTSRNEILAIATHAFARTRTA